jgi:predicted TIM-barrel fold metal-dependent hydrolase
MIVDTHVHPIADDRKKYPRIKDLQNGADHRTVEHLGQPEWPAFALQEMVSTFDACGIGKATLVQAYYTYHHDNSYVLDLTAAHPERFVAVVVLDELDPETPDVLTDLVKTRRVRGWRVMGNKPKGFFADERIFPLWKRAESLGIPITLGSRYPEIPDLLEPLKRTAGVPIAVEHTWSMKLGTPFREYAKPILDLAKLPHVYLKIAAPTSFALREAGLSAKEVWGTLVEAFGPKRMMWGSNYPANWHKHGTIKERLALMKEDLSFLGADEQDRILGGNALEVWPDLK